MSSLLDLLQAASNSAASNVSAPVDAIAWLLKKAGIDVGTPVGGSDWMEQRGLTKPVQQSGASVAGETASLLSPMLLAAKAPQVAKGLLQMADNAAAPRTLRPDQGAIVWHGSPHKFDRFDASKIGTGEGAQAYGHGLYFAELPEVSATYMRTQINNAPELERMALRAGASPEAANAIAQWYHSTKGRGGIDAALDILREPHPVPYMQKHRDKLLAEEPAMRKAWEQFSAPGSLYKVDLPDSAIAKMLDWDKPLSQQAPNVISAVGPRVVKRNGGWYVDTGPKDGVYKFSSESEAASEAAAMLRSRDLTGSALHDSIKTGADADTARMLRELGIPGIRYLDGGSRGAGAGTSNYVVFPGEESLLTILERNGIPVR